MKITLSSVDVIAGWLCVNITSIIPVKRLNLGHLATLSLSHSWSRAATME